jgi:hypothetical protein
VCVTGYCGSLVASVLPYATDVAPLAGKNNSTKGGTAGEAKSIYFLIKNFRNGML